MSLPRLAFRRNNRAKQVSVNPALSVSAQAVGQPPSSVWVLSKPSAPFWNQFTSPICSSPSNTPTRSTDHRKYLPEPGPRPLTKSPVRLNPLANTGFSSNDLPSAAAPSAFLPDLLASRI